MPQSSAEDRLSAVEEEIAQSSAEGRPLEPSLATCQVGVCISPCCVLV